MSARTKAYVGLVIAAGAAGIIPAVPGGLAWASTHLPAFLALTAAMLVAERFVIHLTYRHETLSFSVVEVAATFGLLTMPAAPFVLSVSLGMLGGQVARLRPPLKAAFNTGMYGICAGSAAITFAALQSSRIDDRKHWVPALIAMAAFYVLNQILVATVLALAEGQRLREVARAGGPIMGAIGAGNVSLGLLASYLAGREPAALWMLAVPLALSYAAYKAWVRSRTESRKMAALHRAGSTLSATLDEEDTITGFLREVKEMFRAAGAEVAVSADRKTVHITRDTGDVQEYSVASTGAPANFGAALEAYLQSTGRQFVMVAPLPGEGRRGALIVHDHRSAEGRPAEFPRGDAELVQTLANELSIRMDNVALFNSVSEERAKLVDVVEHTSDGIYQVSPDRRIVTWNSAMERITGYSAEDAVGQMCFNILRARDQTGVDMCSYDCPIVAVCATKSHQERDAQIMTRDGFARWIRYSHSPILDGEGRVTSDVVVVRDVTAERAAAEAKDDFVATVSHELRTPLTPIKGFLHTLLRPGVTLSDEERREVLLRTLHQAEHLEHLVEDLLDVSRLESGDLSLQLETVDVTDLVEQVVGGYQVAQPGRTLRFLAGKAPCCALADEDRLEQVLSNLIENALRYAPESEPIDISVETEKDEIVVAVRDRGPGIPYDKHEKIFERFERLGHYLTRGERGAGLGLYISRRLTEAMGGRLTLASRLGEGSTFHVRLRAAPEGLISRPARRSERFSRLLIREVDPDRETPSL